MFWVPDQKWTNLRLVFWSWQCYSCASPRRRGSLWQSCTGRTLTLEWCVYWRLNFFLIFEVGSQVDLHLVNLIEVVTELLLAEDDLNLRMAVGTGVVSVQGHTVTKQIWTLQPIFCWFFKKTKRFDFVYDTIQTIL